WRDDPSGTVSGPAETLGEPAPPLQPQHLRLHVRPGNGLALVAPERTGIRTHRCLEVLDHLRVARDVADLAGLPLVADDRHRDAPAFTRFADHVPGGDPRVVEHHLTELLGDAVDHAQRTLLDPGLAHRHGEGGQPLVLRDVGVRSYKQEAPVGYVGVAGPDLVTVDHVLVAVARRRGAQRGQVGPGVGLAEALAPTLAAADQPRQEALLAQLAAGCRNPPYQGSGARGWRRASGSELFVEDDVEDRGQVVTAKAGGPGEAEKT